MSHSDFTSALKSLAVIGSVIAIFGIIIAIGGILS